MLGCNEELMSSGSTQEVMGEETVLGDKWKQPGQHKIIVSDKKESKKIVFCVVGHPGW